MNDRYVVTLAIEDGDERHAWGVVVPDLPGCFSAGDTLEEALANAHEAIALHLEGMIEEGAPLPAPRPLSQWKRDPEFAGPQWTWHVAYVDLGTIAGPPERVNIMFPRAALSRIDAAARRAGSSRSAYVVDAALERVKREAPAVTKPGDDARAGNL